MKMQKLWNGLLLALFLFVLTSPGFASGAKEAPKVEKVTLSYWSVGNYLGYDQFWE